MANDATRILKLGIDEMFEDLTYNVAYNEVLKRLKDNGMDDGILKDAIDSGISIMFSAALMHYIQKQEQFLNIIVTRTLALLVAVLNPLTSKVKGVVRKFFKGAKAGIISNFLGVSTEARVGYANVVVTGANALFNRKQSESQYFSHSTFSHQRKVELMHSKDQQLAYAKAKADTFNQTLLFKILSGKFTTADKEIIRKITGGNTEIDVEGLNKISEFMYVKDDKGNISGLSEQFMTMLNGLGYLNGKGK